MINTKRSHRIKLIYDMLDTQGNVSTEHLAKKLRISESTVRRDINYMVSSGKYGKLNRVYGGLTVEDSSAEHEYIFEIKRDLNKKFKMQVAKKAAEFIEQGDKVIIDSGTTCLYLAQELRQKKEVSVITLDVKIAEELGKYGNIESNIIGGVIRPGYYTIGGSSALDNLRRFYAQKVFLSVAAFDLEYGITNASEFEVGVKKLLVEMGAHVYVVTDYTKINTHTMYRVAPCSSINTLITNKELDEQTAQRIRDAGIELVLA